MATLGDVLREIFQTTEPMPHGVISAEQFKPLSFGTNAGRAMSGPVRIEPDPPETGRTYGYGRGGAAGPPVPTEQQAMPPNVAEPLSVQASDIPSAPPWPTPDPPGADNPMIRAIKNMFSSAPQPPDGMDEKTYQLGRKMPTGADFANPTVTVESPARAPATAAATPPAGAPPSTIDVQPRRTAGVTYGDARIPPGMMPRGPGADVPDLFPPGRSPRGPVPASAPAADGPNEMARMFRNFFQGAAAVNPTSPKFSAFSQGAAGSMTANYQEKQAEEQRAAQRARQGFEDDLKVGKARRDDALAKSLIGYRGAKAGGDQAGLRFQDIKSFNEAVDRTKQSYQKAVAEVNTRLKNAEITPEQAAKERADLKTAADAREREIREQYLQKSFTPTIPDKKGEKDAPAGDGKTREAPAKPADKASFDKLPSGAFYVNPADGLIYQKK